MGVDGFERSESIVRRYCYRKQGRYLFNLDFKIVHFYCSYPNSWAIESYDEDRAAHCIICVNKTLLHVITNLKAICQIG